VHISLEKALFRREFLRVKACTVTGDDQMKELEKNSLNMQLPVQKASANGSSPEVPQKRWFCMSLESSGKTFRKEAESPASFLEIVDRSLVTWIDYITDDPYKDLPVVASQMGFGEACLSSLSTCDQLNYEDFDNELWMRFPSIQIRGTEVKAYPFFILIRKNVVLTLHVRLVDKRFIRLRRYSETILRKIPVEASREDKLTILLSRIVDANNDSNFRHLRVIEEFGDDLNRDLMDQKTDKSLLGPKIYEMKHALIIYMNALWESVDVLQAIRYGDAELLTDDPKLVNMFGAMVEEVKNQIGLSEHMSEVLASGIEATQAIYNNQLTIANNRLTISNNQLTILNNRLAKLAAYLGIVGTALLIPNTIATILGNSVWSYGPEHLSLYLILMIGTTLAGSAFMWYLIKKRGLLPKETDDSL